MADFDLRFLLGHALWILAAAGVLAAFSYQAWRAALDERPVREFLRTCPAWRRSVAFGLVAAASGFLILPDTPWFEAALWTAVGLAAACSLRRSSVKH